MSSPFFSCVPAPESALEESAEELYQMAPCGYLSTTIDGRMVRVNRTFAEWLGYEPGDLTQGLHFTDLLTAGGKIFYETHLRLLLRMQAAVDEIALDIVCKDGRVLPVLINARQKRNEAGEPLLNRFTVFNATERRMYERELQRRAQELRRSNEDLSQFAHIASHDLRSPLETIVNYAQLLELKHGEQLGEGKQLLDFMTTAARTMTHLIDSLLAFATVSAEAPDSPAPLDANVPLNIALENLRSVIEESGAMVTHDSLPVVAISDTGLTQIFQNLIGNAIHYRRDDAPRIHVSAQLSVEDQKECWLFSCRDNGIGIEPEYRNRIFEPFKRLHGADIPGSGIGLAVCKKIVERYHGKIWVESEAGQGSTFYFTLPKPE